MCQFGMPTTMGGVQVQTLVFYAYNPQADPTPKKTNMWQPTQKKKDGERNRSEHMIGQMSDVDWPTCSL